MAKVYGYTICCPYNWSIEKLKEMLYEPTLGYTDIQEALKDAQKVLDEMNLDYFAKSKRCHYALAPYTAAIYSVDSDKIPEMKPTPQKYTITEDIRQQLNIRTSIVASGTSIYPLSANRDYREGYHSGIGISNERVISELRRGYDRVNDALREQQAKEQQRLYEQRHIASQQPQNTQPSIPKNAVGIKLVPMEQAAQPGWQPEKSPSNMDIWIKNKDEVMKTCAHMLIDMQQKREIAQKSNVFHAIHDQHMRPIDAQEKYGQPQRYTMPALAVLYDSNKQPTDIYIPSWEEMQTSLSENNFRSASLLSADINDALAGLWMQAKIKAFDTQYKYPLPDNYQPPIISTIDENTKTPIVYEHYGNTRIDPEKTRKVGTNFNLKPDGGLWACAQNEVGQSWHSFTKDWRPARDDDKFVFELSSDAKILKIDSIEAIAHLQQHYPKDWAAKVEATYLKELFESGVPALMVDWEKVSQDYDGIYYSYSKLGNTFGPWDVNSLCVFNPDIVIEHERQGVLHFPVADAFKVKMEIEQYFGCNCYDDELDINNDEHYFSALHEIASKLAEDSDTAARFQYYTALSNVALASVNATQTQTQVPLYDPECIAELNVMADEIDIEQNRDEI